MMMGDGIQYSVFKAGLQFTKHIGHIKDTVFKLGSFLEFNFHSKEIEKELLYSRSSGFIKFNNFFCL